MKVVSFVSSVLLVCLVSSQGTARSSPSPSPAQLRDIWMHNPPLQASAKYLRYVPDGVEVLREKMGPIVPTEAEDSWKSTLQHLENMVERDDNSTDACPICQTAVTSLVFVARNYSDWSEVEDFIVDVCVTLLTAINEDNKARDMCEGLMALQGPVVFNILKSLNMPPPLSPPRPNVESFCESLNMCFPPGTTECPDPRGHKTTRKTDPKPKQPTPKRKHPSPNQVDIGKLILGRQQDILEKVLGHRTRSKRDLEGAIRLVQLTDIHLDPHFAKGAPTDCGMFVCCRDEYSGEGESNQWGDYRCNTPQATVDLFLERVADLEPDFIIYSGDTPPHSSWEETQDSQMKCTELLIESLEATLTGYHVYPNIGNHEMYPTNLYYKGTNETNQMAKEFATLWTPFANFTSSQIETMTQGSYFASRVMPGLRLISFNTNYWYSYNWYNVYSECENHVDAMFDFIEESLAAAKAADEKVIFVGHHPPGNPDMMVALTRKFTDLVLEYKDIIVLHVAGHTHYDEFRLIRHGNDDAEGLVLVTPSMTPLNNINPSARLFFLHPEDFTLLDYEQYYFDLQEVVDNGGDPDIKMAYRATEEYDLDDLSPASFQELASRISTDDGLLHQYHHNYYGRSGRDPGCDGQCRTHHVCRAAFSNFDDSQNCMNNADFPEPQPPSEPTEEPEPGSASRALPGLFLLGVACFLRHFL